MTKFDDAVFEEDLKIALELLTEHQQTIPEEDEETLVRYRAAIESLNALSNNFETLDLMLNKAIDYFVMTEQLEQFTNNVNHSALTPHYFNDVLYASKIFKKGSFVSVYKTLTAYLELKEDQEKDTVRE